MCGTLFNNNATPKSLEDANPARVYHIHIYFDDASAATAKDVVAQAKTLFPGEALGGDRVIGKVVSWLQQNSQGLSILIHPRTDDERKDHLDSAMWLGKPVPFSDAFFAQLKNKGIEP